MRSKDPHLMQSILEFIEICFFQDSHYPSCAEIGNRIGVSRNTVHRYLVSMNETGMISYRDGVAKTPKMEMVSDGIHHAGVIGSVPCGPLTEMEETIEEYVPLPVSIFGEGDKFILHAVGDSMIGAGIDDGDLVVIKRQHTAREGDIVVALSGSGNTLKTLKGNKKDGFVLHPENPEMEDIPVKELVVQGVAEFVIKKL